MIGGDEMLRGIRFGWGVGLLLLSTEGARAQQCQPAGTDQTCTNSIFLSGGVAGLNDNATATITNTSVGTIVTNNAGGTGFGIFAGTNANVTNSGTISGTMGTGGLLNVGIRAVDGADVTNSGTISGAAASAGSGYGVFSTTANVTNSGIISGAADAGAGFGVAALQDARVVNTGIISGTTGSGFGTGGFGIFSNNNADVINYGVVVGTAGADGSANGVSSLNNVNVINFGTIAGVAGDGNVIGVGVGASNNVTVTNAGRISGTVGDGLQTLGAGIVGLDVNVTNSGSVTGSAGDGLNQSGKGIDAINAVVTNSGTISGTVGSGFLGSATGIRAANNAIVANSGTISSYGGSGSGAFGISAGNEVRVTNSGTITAAVGPGGVIANGVFAAGRATVTNYGSIYGVAPASGFGDGILVAGNADVTNSGIIFGTTAALEFVGNADVLTVLPGSRIIGAILLGGGGDTVNFRGGNHNLTFDTLAGATVTGTTPFAVLGNRAAAVDLTPFAANWRTLADFSRGVSDAVPVFSGSVSGGAAPLAFAGSESPASRFDDAFAAISGVASAYAGEAAVFKAPTATYADGTTVWARGFAGQRTQQQDGVLLRNANMFYGGMIGGDFVFRPDLRVGVFLGGGQTRTRLDLGQGGTDSDLLFGGAYARYDIGRSFLHAAVQGGSSRSATTRTVNNNLVANGLETATASYNGWYLSPEATFGHRFALGQLAGATYTLTPSVRIRYLYGTFDGYTETGTTAPLTVGGRTVSALEERGEMKLTRSVALNPQNQLSTSVFGGVLGSQRLGSAIIGAALLGQAIPFATPGKADVWGGFGGLGLEWRTRNVTFYSAAEYLALSDNANVVSGRAGMRVAF
jgi:hypothetical protein